jgi:hypothetical protein
MVLMIVDTWTLTPHQGPTLVFYLAATLQRVAPKPRTAREP